MLTLVHAEPSDRSIWFGLSALLVLVAIGGNGFAGSGMALACLLASAASAAVAARRVARQVLLDRRTNTVVLRTLSLAGHEDRLVPRDEIATFDCTHDFSSRIWPFRAWPFRHRLEPERAAYLLRMVLISGETIDLTKPYAVPKADGTPWRDIAPFQAARALGNALDVPVNGLDTWQDMHRARSLLM
jgi:hypothetical protein